VATTGALLTTTDVSLATTDVLLTTTGDHWQPLTTMKYSRNISDNITDRPCSMILSKIQLNLAANFADISV
jgi:hypothetical protein